MATVTGLTAEKTMALLAEKADVGHSHAPSGGGGGGGPLSLSYLHQPTKVETAQGGGTYKRALFHNWLEMLVHGPSVGVTSDASGCWAYAEEGWYQLSIRFWVGFTGTPPTNAEFSFNSWEGMQFSKMEPIVPPGITAFNRQYPGFDDFVTSPPYWAPSAADVASVEGPNSLSISWNGNSELTNGNGGPVNPVTMYVARLA